MAVSGGNKVIKPINKILNNVTFDMVIRSQDWHCKNHVSFASQHKNASVYSTISLNYTKSGKICGNYPYKETKTNCAQSDVKYQVSQVMWPDHCIINTTDADFVDKLEFPSNVITVQKGYHCQVDSYSAFFDNGGFSHTELDARLKSNKITRVYVAGLATDYCVSWTAKDAKKLGYESYVVTDASQHISNATLVAQKAEWVKLGVKTILSDALIKESKQSGGTSVFLSGLVVVAAVVMQYL